MSSLSRKRKALAAFLAAGTDQPVPVTREQELDFDCTKTLITGVIDHLRDSYEPGYQRKPGVAGDGQRP